MAFSFGGASSAASTPSSSAFSFGGTATPSFGATTSTPAFGAASTPSLFGGASTSAFGGTSTSLFGGAASTPAFGTSSGSHFGSSTTGAFGAASSPSLFGAPAASNALTSFSAPALGGAAFGSAFGAGSNLFGGAQQQQQQQMSGALCGKEGKPLTHFTKWDDISPQGQNYLLELERIISQHREECRQLDDNGRLWGQEGISLKQDIVADERALGQALTGLQAALKGDIQSVAVFREKAVALLHDTELAVRTFQRTHRWRAAGKVLPGQALPPGVREQLNGPIMLPSLYLRRVTAAFQEALDQYKLLVTELEGLLPGDAEADKPTAVAALPVVLHNLHDFFNHVAARLEKLHDGVTAAKEAFLERLREDGDMSDPFEEADRKDALQHMAARAKTIVIPPGQGPAEPQVMASAPQTAPATGSSLFGGGGTTSSLFGVGAAAAVTSAPAGGNLFGTPAAGAAWGASSAAAGSTSSTRRGRSRK